MLRMYLSGSRDEKGVVGAFDERHHADEPHSETTRIGRRLGGPAQSRTGGSHAAERNSTDKIATLHFSCSCCGGLSIGAVHHQRAPGAEPTAILLNRTALDLLESLLRASAAGDLAMEGDQQITSRVLVSTRQRPNDRRNAGRHERASDAQRALASIALFFLDFIDNDQVGIDGGPRDIAGENVSGMRSAVL